VLGSRIASCSEFLAIEGASLKSAFTITKKPLDQWAAIRSMLSASELGRPEQYPYLMQGTR